MALPIKVEFNGPKNELIVCTRKDIRFINLANGRMKFSYSGFMDSEDEITVFKTIDQNNKFIIGNHRGLLQMFSYLSGEKIQNLLPHTNEITSLKMDF